MKNNIALVTFCVALLGATGCDWLGRDNKAVVVNKEVTNNQKPVISSPDVVASIDGEAVVTKDEYEAFLQAMGQQLQMLPMLPEEQQKSIHNQLLDNLVDSNLVSKDIKVRSLDQSVDYQRNLKLVLDNAKRQFDFTMFANELAKALKVTDNEAKKYYEENRTKENFFKRPPFLERPAMVTADVVNVGNDKQKAEEILAEAKALGDLKEAAEVHGFSVTTLSDVTLYSDKPHRAVAVKIVEGKETPYAAMVEVEDNGNKVYYVFNRTDRKDETYASFDKVKEHLKEIVLSNKYQAAYAEEIKKLRKKYTISVNRDYLSSLVVKAPAQEQPEVENVSEVEEQ